jgi:YD repeat-containing protein
MSDLPSVLRYSTASFRGVAAVGDTSDDTNSDPDMVPMKGTVQFVANVERSRVPGSLPQPMTVFPKIVVCALDSEGYLTDPAGNRDVKVVATGQSTMNPPIASYTVLFQLTGVTKFSKTVLMPADTVVDLTTAIEVPAAPGQEQAAWELAVSEALAAKTAAEAAASAAAASAASVAKGQPNGTAGLDSGARVPDGQLPSRLSAASLSATFVRGNPSLSVAYNLDGSVASTVEDGVTTTFTYNADGSVRTQTRAGATKTFSYDSNGNVTGAA